MTEYLQQQRQEFYQELRKIMNRIATDQDKIAWISEQLDPLLEQCFEVGMECGGEYQYAEGYRDGEIAALEQGDR